MTNRQLTAEAISRCSSFMSFLVATIGDGEITSKDIRKTALENSFFGMTSHNTRVHYMELVRKGVYKVPGSLIETTAALVDPLMADLPFADAGRGQLAAIFEPDVEAFENEGGLIAA